MKVKKVIPKHDLIKTHTARRSGATNMYLAGIPSIDIMKITGHKTEREFLKYIRVTKEETAEMLSNHSYFKPEMKEILADWVKLLREEHSFTDQDPLFPKIQMEKLRHIFLVLYTFDGCSRTNK